MSKGPPGAALTRKKAKQTRASRVGIAPKKRKNTKTNLNEYYNLIYQYRNDCLTAAIEYNKTYYSDGDLKPNEELFFSLTIVPFTKINTTNLNQ